MSPFHRTNADIMGCCSEFQELGKKSSVLSMLLLKRQLFKIDLLLIFVRVLSSSRNNQI